jgi:hypothetical protein
MRWVGHVAFMGEEMKVYRVLVGKPERKRQLGRPRRRWEDGFRMDLREIGWWCVEWIQLAQEQAGTGLFMEYLFVVYFTMNFQ